MRYAVSANTGFSWDFLIVALFTKIARWFLALAYGREVSLQKAFFLHKTNVSGINAPMRKFLPWFALYGDWRHYPSFFC